MSSMPIIKSSSGKRCNPWTKGRTVEMRKFSTEYRLNWYPWSPIHESLCTRLTVKNRLEYIATEHHAHSINEFISNIYRCDGSKHATIVTFVNAITMFIACWCTCNQCAAYIHWICFTFSCNKQKKKFCVQLNEIFNHLNCYRIGRQKKSAEYKEKMCQTQSISGVNEKLFGHISVAQF